MSCDCRETIESKLLARFKEQVPDAQNHEASLKGYGLVRRTKVSRSSNRSTGRMRRSMRGLERTLDYSAGMPV